jgi:hypothetical protein
MSDYWKEVEAVQPGASVSKEAAEFLVPTNKTLRKRVGSIALLAWFAAGLSAANLVLAYIQAPIRMIIGFFATEVAFAVGRKLGPVALGIALIGCVAWLGFTAALGYFIKRCQTWAFIAAMVLAAIDAALLFYFTRLEDGLMAFVFRLAAIGFIIFGLKAARVLRERQKLGKA